MMIRPLPNQSESFPNAGFKLTGWLFAMTVALITASWIVLKVLGLN